MTVLDLTESTHKAHCLDVLDPATGEVIGRIPAGSPDAADAAVRAARAAQPAWARTAPAERAAALKAAARRVRAHADELAELQTREGGKPLADSLGGVEAGIAAIEQYAELGPLHRGRTLQGGWDAADLMVHEPRGVVALLVPWNDPIAIAAGQIAAALVTGNAVVYKPSQKTPLSAARLVELLDLGDILQVLHGDKRAAQPLATHPGVDLVIRPGEEAAGSHLVVIDAGVDAEWAAEEVASSAFAGAGQSCGSVERVHVHRTVAEPFLEALAARARALRIGPGLASGTEIGPLIDDDQRVWVHRQVQDAVYEGAELLAGGEPLYGPGYFYPPTVLTGAPDDALVICGETRGPVVTVRVVDSFGEALMGSERIGIASVLTPAHANAQRAWRELPARTVSVNSVFSTPRPGAEPELLAAVTRTKVVHLS